MELNDKVKLLLVGGVLLVVAYSATRAKITPKPILEPDLSKTRVSRGQNGFVPSVAKVAQFVNRRTGIPASILLAQAIKESAWGTSEEATGAENYLGFKAEGKPIGMFWDGSSKVFAASEGGSAAFCKYKGVYYCFMHYAQHIHSSSRYQAALPYLDNPARYADEIGKAGYAGSSTYGQRVFDLAKRERLGTVLK
jgi:flagellum-specific peptidoglycan hydrolase FlgJ